MLPLLCEHIVLRLREKDALSDATSIQDGAISHNANSFKEFLIPTFGDERITRKHCKFTRPPWSPDMSPEDFCLWGYLKSRLC
ncbi:hypothetical protein TNCV_1204271 [Trichonephila clavipes]|nr:hypothetical protein TNCV_1204271 [Trichonephila clavipes]